MTALNTDRTEGHFKMFMGCEDADHVKKGVSWIPHSSSAHTHKKKKNNMLHFQINKLNKAVYN